MKILNLEKKTGVYTGLYLKNRVVYDFTFGEKGLSVDHEYPMRETETYRFFAERMGKFWPYRFFLKKPVKVEEITQESLDNAWKEIQSLLA